MLALNSCTFLWYILIFRPQLQRISSRCCALHFLPFGCTHSASFSILNLVSSSFHHLLLNGDGFFRGVVSAIALLIASVRSLANLSIASSVMSVFRSGEGGRYFHSLFSCAFQSVLVKLYGGCAGVVNLGVRSRMVSIGRWLEA